MKRLCISLLLITGLLCISMRIFSGEFEKDYFTECVVEQNALYTYCNNIKRSLTVAPFFLFAGVYAVEKQSPGYVEKKHIMVAAVTTGICLLGISITDWIQKNFFVTVYNKTMNSFANSINEKMGGRIIDEYAKILEDTGAIISQLPPKQRQKIGKNIQNKKYNFQSTLFKTTADKLLENFDSGTSVGRSKLKIQEDN